MARERALTQLAGTKSGTDPAAVKESEVLPIPTRIPRRFEKFYNPWAKVGNYHAQSTRFFTYALPDKELRDSSVRLYYALVGIICTVEKQNEVTYTIEELCRYSGLADGTLRKALKQLKERGLITTAKDTQHNKITIRLIDPGNGKPYPSLGEELNVEPDPYDLEEQFNSSGTWVGDYEPLEEEQPAPELQPAEPYKRRSHLQLTEDEIRRYYEHAIGVSEFKKSGDRFLMAPCEHHGDGYDHNYSMSITKKTGYWQCFACHGTGVEDWRGNIYKFEQKRSNCGYTEAIRRVLKIVGATDVRIPRTVQPEWIPIGCHQYCGMPDHQLVCEVRRYPPKPGDTKDKRLIFRPENGEMVAKAPAYLERIPYNLPEVLEAKLVVICEGERDADTISHLGLVSANTGTPIATSTNLFGAGKWQDRYSEWFLYKKIIICGDRDVPGLDHVRQVVTSLRKKGILEEYIRVVELTDYPILQEHGRDISDWIIEDGHTPADVVKLFGEDWVRLPCHEEPATEVIDPYEGI